MGDAYDLHQHSHCIVISMENREVYLHVLPTVSRSGSILEYKLRKKACISYNNKKTKVVNWGRTSFKVGSYIQIEDFVNGLYRIFQKGESNRDENDIFFLKAISDFIRLMVKESTECFEMKINSLDQIHYAFIVPSEWEEKVKEDLIRPIFIQAGLISNDDHQDRLLICSDIEAIVYYLHNKDYSGYPFQRAQNTILCRLTPVEKNTAIIKLDLIQTINSRYDFPTSDLFPKIVRSNSLLVTSKDIKECIDLFLKDRLLDANEGIIAGRWNFLKRLGNSLRHKIQKEGLYYNGLPDIMDRRNEDERIFLPGISERTLFRINKPRAERMRAVRSFDIHTEFGKTLFDKMKNILSDNLVKEYVFLVWEDQYSSKTRSHSRYKKHEILDPYFVRWLMHMSEYNRRCLNSIATVHKSDLSTKRIRQDEIVMGATKIILEAIKSADIYCKPRIQPTENPAASSSMFLNSKPNSIFNINISLKSTLLTCSYLRDDGIIEEVLDHNYFTIDYCIPPLEQFYSVINTTTLHTTKEFIQLADKYLIGDLSFFNTDDKNIKTDIATTIETILGSKCHASEELMSIQQSVYIKAFILMYMIYLKHVISNKILVGSRYDNKNIKIGYAVSIENILLKKVIGTKDDLRETIYASGLVRKGDDFTKLRIIVQGEQLLPLIQKSLRLEFPVKSFFVLAQLHQDYIQLTMNQVVTGPGLEEEQEQESIILQDKIIYIKNIYDSLCLYMWNNIINNMNLIKLCDTHNEIDGGESLELLTLESKKEFTANFKRCISQNILNKSSNCAIENVYTIRLKASCKCMVCLTLDDIVELSFKPALQEIASIVSTSLINVELFVYYTTVEYIFNLVHFNNNPQFQDILVKILEESPGDFKERGIETLFLALPQLPFQLFQPVMGRQSTSYRGFKIGTLHQVFSENYAFLFDKKKYSQQLLYKTKITGREAVKLGEKIAFPIIKKGGVISDIQPKLFYLNLQKSFDKEPLNITFHKLERFEGLQHNGTLSLKDNMSYWADFFTLYPNWESLKTGDNIPVLISVFYQGYSSSLQITTKLVGESLHRKYTREMGEPLTLVRF